VVLAAPDEEPAHAAPGPATASELIGGGYTCLRDGQGREQAGTIGCVVQRQGTFYALTNKHVAGAADEDVFAVVGGSRDRIGAADGVGVTKLTLPTLFPGWAGERTFVNLDAGLIRIDDVSRWTAQVFGVGEIGELYDATPQSVTLDLIGLPVRAFGGASGVLEGEIRALFFRYQSAGNYDYVSDLFIGPRGPTRDGRGGWQPQMRSPAPQTRPGDSGSIWFYDPPMNTPAGSPYSDEALRLEGHEPPERGERARRLRPIAMQWGGARIQDAAGTSAYALATFLSTICRVLDVEIVRDWSVGWDEYWGKIGHFAIGWKACASPLLGGKLAALMLQNQARIGFGDDKLELGSEFRLGRDGFVPLADVPDYVWVPAARFGKARAHEPQQHFADVDLPPMGERADASDFLQRCALDPALVQPRVWKEFFAAFAAKGTGPEEGSLPFRVWQLFDAMVDFVKARDLVRFVATAGALAHYVGDASQPLHCSYLHHGELPMMKVAGDARAYPVAHGSDAFKEYAKTPEAKVHAIYEEGMLEIEPSTALAVVDRQLTRMALRDVAIARGHDAAWETVLLMDRARKRLAPATIIAKDDPSLGPRARAKRLWSDRDVQTGTIESLAESVQLLARLWQAAWQLGDGEDIADEEIVELGEEELQAVYRSADFLLPMTLAEMEASGRFAVAGGRKRAATTRPANGHKRRPRPHA
jgi:hypothetical protein